MVKVRLKDYNGTAKDYDGVSSISVPTVVTSEDTETIVNKSFYNIEGITAAVADVSASKQFIAADGTIQNGTATDRTATDLQVNNLTVTAPAGLYAADAQTTLSDENLLAANVKSGVTIFGTTGTYNPLPQVGTLTISKTDGDDVTVTLTYTDANAMQQTVSENGSYNVALNTYFYLEIKDNDVDPNPRISAGTDVEILSATQTDTLKFVGIMNAATVTITYSGAIATSDEGEM